MLTLLGSIRRVVSVETRFQFVLYGVTRMVLVSAVSSPLRQQGYRVLRQRVKGPSASNAPKSRVRPVGEDSVEESLTHTFPEGTLKIVGRKRFRSTAYAATQPIPVTGSVNDFRTLGGSTGPRLDSGTMSDQWAVLKARAEAELCLVCGKGREAGVMHEQELGLVHDDVCYQSYLKSSELKGFESAHEKEREAKAQWEREGRALGGRRADRKKSEEYDVPFQVGDWLIRGEENGFIRRSPNPDYREAEKLTGYKKQSLYKFASVSRLVPDCIRMQKQLPWAIHQTVATAAHLGQERQRELLQRALHEKLSVRQFRVFVNDQLANRASLHLVEANLSTADRRAVRAIRMCDQTLPPPDFTKLMRTLSSMTPAIRQSLVDRLKETAARLTRCAKEISKGDESIPRADAAASGK